MTSDLNEFQDNGFTLRLALYELEGYKFEPMGLHFLWLLNF